MKKEFAYNGHEILEVMQDAKNYNEYLYRLVKKQQDLLDPDSRNNLKVLDFGAGVGTFADIFKEKGTKVDCLEIDATGRKTLKSKGYSVYKSIGEISQKYDVIYAFNVLEHIEDDAKVLRELRECLSDNGVIVIYVPAFNIIFTNLDVVVDHVRRYRLKDLQTLAVRENLKVKEMKYCDPVGFVLALIYKLGRGSGNISHTSIRIFDKYLFPISEFVEPLFKKMFGKNALIVYEK